MFVMIKLGTDVDILEVMRMRPGVSQLIRKLYWNILGDRSITMQ